MSVYDDFLNGAGGAWDSTSDTASEWWEGAGDSLNSGINWLGDLASNLGDSASEIVGIEGKVKNEKNKYKPQSVVNNTASQPVINNNQTIMIVGGATLILVAAFLMIRK